MLYIFDAIYIFLFSRSKVSKRKYTTTAILYIKYHCKFVNSRGILLALLSANLHFQFYALCVSLDVVCAKSDYKSRS